jgi:hypothetical protein
MFSWWRCLPPVIPATYEAEIRRISVRSQPRQLVRDPISKNPSQKKGWRSVWSGRALAASMYTLITVYQCVLPLLSTMSSFSRTSLYPSHTIWGYPAGCENKHWANLPAGVCLHLHPLLPHSPLAPLSGTQSLSLSGAEVKGRPLLGFTYCGLERKRREDSSTPGPGQEFTEKWPCGQGPHPLTDWE